MTIDLRLGDCLELMREIPDASIDAVITDPPYGVNYQSNYRTNPFNHIHQDDTGIDLDAVIGEMRRIIRDGRHIYLFGRFDLAKYELGATAELIWDKGGAGMGDLSLPYGSSHEYIQFCNVQKSKRHIETGKGRLSARLRRGTVLNFTPDNSKKYQHPTQKPILLMQSLIESSSCIGDTILDPFMGSGTTGVACVKLNRNFIGMEINPDYFAIAQRRIAEAQAQMTMALTT